MLRTRAKNLQSFKKGSSVTRIKKPNGLVGSNTDLKCWTALEIFKPKENHSFFYNCYFISIKTPIYEIKAQRLQKLRAGKKCNGLSRSANFPILVPPFLLHCPAFCLNILLVGAHSLGEEYNSWLNKRTYKTET